MASLATGGSHVGYDYSFKILLIGDSGVGKSSLLVSFISSQLEDLTPTIGTFSLFSSSFACFMYSGNAGSEFLVRSISN
jgi:septin family protein